MGLHSTKRLRYAEAAGVGTSQQVSGQWAISHPELAIAGVFPPNSVYIVLYSLVFGIFIVFNESLQTIVIFEPFIDLSFCTYCSGLVNLPDEWRKMMSKTPRFH